MSKFFQDAGNNKRSWMCFVCGRKYSEYEEYKTHIITEHDEGREYLKCPACDAPVRDMRAHYRVKHPKRVLPKDQQMRVVVWNDFSPNGIKKKTRKPNIRTGYFPSEKNGMDLYYRSGLEADFYKCLEEDNSVKSFRVEPFKVPYYWQGKWHDYTPDIYVEYSDGDKEIWEVKPSSRTDDDQNKAKWASAKSATENVGWKFVVMTEVVLDKYKAELKRRRHSSSCDTTQNTTSHKKNPDK